MLRFSRLQSALIVGVCLLGLLLSVPNFLRPGALPAWIPQRTVNLGLDLQGGSYLVLEIDSKTVVKERLLNIRSEIRQALLKARVPNQGVTATDQGVSVLFSSDGGIPAARTALAEIINARSDGPAGATSDGRSDRRPAPDASDDGRSHCRYEREGSRAIGVDRTTQDRRSRRQ